MTYEQDRALRKMVATPFGEFAYLDANDTGGALAQALAVREPSRIRTLTLTNCEARDWMPSKSELGQLVATLAEEGQLAQVLKANYDDREGTRQGPFAA